MKTESNEILKNLNELYLDWGFAVEKLNPDFMHIKLSKPSGTGINFLIISETSGKNYCVQYCTQIPGIDNQLILRNTIPTPKNKLSTYIQNQLSFGVFNRDMASTLNLD